MGGSVRINRWGLLLVGAVAFLVFYTFRGGKSVDKPIPSSTAPVSLKELLSVAIEAAHRGGVEVKRIREQVDDIGEKSKGKTKEGANNPVTDGDMLSHKAMYNSLRKAFPHVHVISEEDDPEQVDLNLIKMPHLTNDEINEIVKDDVLVPANDIDVWIDPLDATQEYTENLRHFVTTMVCVAVKGKPILGVIHKPFDGVTAWGWAGPNHVSQSIAEDVKRSQTQSDTDLSQSRIIVSRSHAGSVHDVAKNAFGAKAVVTPAGGAGYKAWEVVKGNQDVYVHVTLIKKWDICAGDAILNALGGQLTTLTGEKVDYSGRPAHEKNEGGVVATLHDHAAYVDALEHVEVVQGSKPK
ncbi:hypothetical protein TCAL_07065 [Tigriopus californicus]|uniref:Putative inositol monophosphatase 3 n=2 Tax=Tigriopus californicus TaxID=6832 RepID=A0A553PQG9_TIGCA|nr:hypothetical protein TCAL_07065 [Tigriopus californicus]|eukprot:TCALIF_07065-PA protein Name:"Similar to impad1 Inositol monophosphatase 3 (Xenopus laevis)" AED:0.01 eAED:0.01 QI:0/-1/0/1/-1/1/1/0/352